MSGVMNKVRTALPSTSGVEVGVSPGSPDAPPFQLDIHVTAHNEVRYSQILLLFHFDFHV